MKILNVKSDLISNEEGQGVLEYMLLLVISVAVIVGILFQFNKNFAEYADNYFGQYLSCLLEAGELPSLGVENNEVTASSCDANYKPFTAADGRPPNNSNNNGNGSSNNSNDNSTSDGRGNTRSRDRFSAGGTGGQSGGSSSGRRRSSSAGGAAGGSNNRFSSGISSGEKTKEKIVEGAGSSASLRVPKKSKVNGESNGGQNNRIGRLKAYDPNKDKNKGSKVSVKKIKNDESSKQRKKSFRMAASLKKTKSPELDSGLDFGDYLRYLIIAVILIVLLFVVGGQIFQATKGAED